MEAIQSWVSNHKLTSMGTIWASAVGASLVYSSTRSPLLKPSLRLIHARMHAQALTLGVLSGAAIYHYYEKQCERQGDQTTSTAATYNASSNVNDLAEWDLVNQFSA